MGKDNGLSTLSETKILTLGYLGCGTGTDDVFDQCFEHTELVTPLEIKNGAEIDALVIWGGEDISPSLYGEKPCKQCYAGPLPSRRDVLERDACLAAIARGVPIIGVCRGAQLLCALAGGRLIQDVENHGRSHMMITDEGVRMATTSVHHQMMYPYNLKPLEDFKMLAWAAPKQSAIHRNQDGEHDTSMDDKMEPEIVWFPKIKGLAIQGHPEFVGNPDDSPFVQYCLDLCDQYVLGQG